MKQHGNENTTPDVLNRYQNVTVAAPAAATILSDFGADVIKIEPPGAGDPYRQLPKFPGNPESDYNYGWMLDNRNKRGLALDIAKQEGQAVLGRLVSQADVFITNYPLAVRQRLGIGYEALAPLNDRLIYASFSGYGERGEEANKPSFDMTAWWARSGMMDQVRPAAAADNRQRGAVLAGACRVSGPERLDRRPTLLLQDRKARSRRRIDRDTG